MFVDRTAANTTVKVTPRALLLMVFPISERGSLLGLWADGVVIQWEMRKWGNEEMRKWENEEMGKLIAS